jgi:hypothetical protein
MAFLKSKPARFVADVLSVVIGFIGLILLLGLVSTVEGFIYAYSHPIVKNRETFVRHLSYVNNREGVPPIADCNPRIDFLFCMNVIERSALYPFRELKYEEIEGETWCDARNTSTPKISKTVLIDEGWKVFWVNAYDCNARKLSRIYGPYRFAE